MHLTTLPRLARRSFLALLLCAGGCASPVGEERWLELRTAHFELVSSASAARTREIARELESFHGVLGEILGLGPIDLALPARVYVFGDRRSFAVFEPTRKFAGYLVPAEDRSYIAIDASRLELAFATTRHELVHTVVRNRSRFRYPTWYDEGLADFLSTVELKDGTLQLGTPPSGRAGALLFGTPLSLEQVLTARGIRSWSPRPLGMFYAQSWALTHFLELSWQRGYRDRRAALRSYLSRLDAGEAPLEAYVQAFGEGVDVLQGELERYLEENQFPRLGIAVPPSAPASDDSDAAPRALPAAEALSRLAALAFANGQTELSDQLAARAIARDPGHAQAQARTARAAALRRSFAAFPPLDALPPLERDDAELQRLCGDALAARVRLDAELALPEREGLLDAARARYRRSIELDPAQAAAHASLGRMALLDLAPTDAGLAEGIAALERARDIIPASESVTLSLAQLELQRGQQGAASLLLRNLLQFAHGTEQSRRQLETLLAAAGLEPLASGEDAYRQPRLDVERPAPASLVRAALPLVEVAGRAGLGDLRAQDVIVAIDESGSTLFASGDDVDGDGLKGRSGRDVGSLLVPPRTVTSDYDDSLLATELAAARELAARLNPATTRTALVTFGAGSRLRAPLGPPQELLAALERYEPGENLLGSRVGAALKHAMLEFAERRSATPRRRVVVLMSDGDVPVIGAVPSPSYFATEALETADSMGEFGITVHALLVGRNDGPTGQTFRELARRTGGVFIELRRPGDALDALAGSRLSGLESVTLRNRTLGQPGRAVRTFADGSFDGYLPLAVGANEIEVRAKLSGNHELTEIRTLRYEPPVSATEETQRQAEALRETLRQRTAEIEAREELRRARLARRSLDPAGDSPDDTADSPEDRERIRRELEVEVEKTPPNASDAP